MFLKCSERFLLWDLTAVFAKFQKRWVSLWRYFQLWKVPHLSFAESQLKPDMYQVLHTYIYIYLQSENIKLKVKT